MSLALITGCTQTSNTDTNTGDQVRTFSNLKEAYASNQPLKCSITVINGTTEIKYDMYMADGNIRLDYSLQTSFQDKTATISTSQIFTKNNEAYVWGKTEYDGKINIIPVTSFFGSVVEQQKTNLLEASYKNVNCIQSFVENSLFVPPKQ